LARNNKLFPHFRDRVRLKPVYFLLGLGLGFAGSAAGLGLGELDVRSSLGEPLHATVNILDPGETTAQECFSLAPSEGSIAPSLRAQLSLEQSGGKTLLHIRTPYSVNDPIAQFALVSACEGRLQRDYVILLDPPAQITPAIIETAPAAAERSVPIAPPAPRATPPQRQAKRTPPAATSQPASDSRQAGAPSAQAAASDSAPRLVLSGKRKPSLAGAELALRLDTNLPDPTRFRPQGLTDTELSDENTALSRKLAHLEAQMLALQKRNAELEARLPAAPATATPAASQPVKWPLALLIMGLLTGAGTLAVWLRRRKQEPVNYMVDDWTRPSTIAMPGSPKPATVPVPTPNEMQPAPERMPEIAQPVLPESTEIKDDILDQAEVYMAHGHGELAVHLLQEHLRDAPGESPVPWLLLLDLLHREGDTENYAAASAECRRHFNINLSGHPVSQDNEIGMGLEAYPHLLDELVEKWRSPDLDDFFKDLIYDHRGGTRMGFEPSAYRDLLLLRAIAQDVLPLAA
jgi:hypothetical protein